MDGIIGKEGGHVRRRFYPNLPSLERRDRRMLRSVSSPNQGISRYGQHRSGVEQYVQRWK